MHTILPLVDVGVDVGERAYTSMDGSIRRGRRWRSTEEDMSVVGTDRD